MKEFLTQLITKLVDSPADVEVSETELSEGIYQYKISAHPEDIGKIIGKKGKIIAAIRNVAKVLAIKQNKQIRIEVS